MPVLVEARRKDRDLFFGRKDGWYVVHDGRRFNPGELFESSYGVLVFEEDGYETSFEFDKSAIAQNLQRIWVKCMDSKSRVHIALKEDEQEPPLLSAVDGRRRRDTERQKRLGLIRRASSFRQEPSPYRQITIRAKVRCIYFHTNDWNPFFEEQDSLQLTVSFQDCESQHLYAKAPSEQVTPAYEFQTFGSDLGVSLFRINDEVSRVVRVEPDGLGAREGVLVGDLLLKSRSEGNVRQWRRMEVRKAVFDGVVEFPYELEENERSSDPRRTVQNELLTFSLRLTPAPDSITLDDNLKPLELLFGTQPVISSNGIGNCQVSFPIDLNLMKIGLMSLSESNYLQVEDPEFSLGYERVLPSDIRTLRINMQASVSLSLIANIRNSSTGVRLSRRHTDLALFSLRGIHVINELFADGSMSMEASLRSFQIDDQRPDAAFPVAIFPTPLADVAPEAPAVRAILTVRAPEQTLLNIKEFDFFLTETTLKLHESFLLNLLEYGSDLAKQTGAIRNDERQEKSSVENKRKDSHTKPTSARRIFVDSADFKPMRFNITFQSAALASEKSVQMLIRQLPVVSALITAVASVSDAPLRLGAVRLRRESKTPEALGFAIAKHYSGMLTRGLLAIAGSTDILGSPVHLIGSFSKGAFSFFYEPALALSLGYGQLGRGMQKAGTELLSNSAGGVFESLSKMTNVVAKAVAQMSYDQTFASVLDDQLKPGSFHEPINFREGVSSGFFIIIRSILDAFVGLFPSQKARRRMVRTKATKNVARSLQPLIALLLKPAAGFFAALHELSVGIRNAVSTDAFRYCFPLRLPRPQEIKVRPYSATRSAGYLLARHRFGMDVRFLLNEICQLERAISDDMTHSMVTTIIVTSEWLVACRETLLDVWAIPLQLMEDIVAHEGPKLTFNVLGEAYTIRCRFKLDVLALQKSFQFAKKLRSGEIGPQESFLDTLPRKEKPSLAATGLWDARSRRSSLRKIATSDLTIGSVDMGGSELDVAGSRVNSAEIQSSGYWPDGVFRYQIRLVSVDGKVEWIVERRYSEFLKFRDQACRFLSVSRRSMPLPGRRPWKLSVVEQEERWKGLQAMLDLSLRIDLLAESEVLREFLTRGADHVSIKD